MGKSGNYNEKPKCAQASQRTPRPIGNVYSVFGMCVQSIRQKAVLFDCLISNFPATIMPARFTRRPQTMRKGFRKEAEA
jgi:hypothetical protein